MTPLSPGRRASKPALRVLAALVAVATAASAGLAIAAGRDGIGADATWMAPIDDVTGRPVHILPTVRQPPAPAQNDSTPVATSTDVHSAPAAPSLEKPAVGAAVAEQAAAMLTTQPSHPVADLARPAQLPATQGSAPHAPAGNPAAGVDHPSQVDVQGGLSGSGSATHATTATRTGASVSDAAPSPISAGYTIPPGTLLSRGLQAYVSSLGWSLRWNVDDDYMLDTPLPIPAGNVIDGVSYVIHTYHVQGGLVGEGAVFATPNRIVVIKPLTVKED